MTAQPKPETRPAGCCGKCPPIAGGGYDCTCEDNPRCTAQPKPTAAEVVAAHINCQWRGGLSLDCGSELPPPSSPDIRAAHIADVLAAAGLLATAERDAQVAAQAWDEGYRSGFVAVAYDVREKRPNPYRTAGGAT